jgi:hypothetical protein
MESTSSDDDVRAITLRYESEGSGRFLVLSNGNNGGEMYFNHPEDLGALYQTALELWSQGDIVVKGEAADDIRGTGAEMIDSAKRAFSKSEEQQ